MHHASQGIRILPAAIFAVAASLALALPVCAQSDEEQRRYEEWKQQQKAKGEAAFAPSAVTPAPGLPSPEAATVHGGIPSIEDVDGVPYIDKTGREGYKEFLDQYLIYSNRAFAISIDGSWAWSAGLARHRHQVKEKALANCQISSPVPCFLYAVNDEVVWKGPTTAPVIETQSSATAEPRTTEWAGVISGGGERCTSFSIEILIDEDGGIVGEATLHRTKKRPRIVWDVSGTVDKSNSVYMRIVDIDPGDLTLVGRLTGSSISIAQPSSRRCDPPRSGVLKVSTNLRSVIPSIEDVDAVPYLNQRGRLGYLGFLRAPFPPRAFAISRDGAWGRWAVGWDGVWSIEEVKERALANCQKHSSVACFLYAVNETVVWKPQ